MARYILLPCILVSNIMLAQVGANIQQKKLFGVWQKGSYQFQKRNHPKNNDPMIVINSQAYVTFYNKAPW